MTTLPILYSFRRCPYAMRARLALAVSGQTCELREIDLKARPLELLSASPKGTVPVLVLPDGEVLDESLAIMEWTLGNHDPEGWLPTDEETWRVTRAWIAANDGDFKLHLDRYKYASRKPGGVAEEHRDQAAVWLQSLEARLVAQPCLAGAGPGLADMALAPFVRQFAFTDRDWFDQQPWPHLLAWLGDFLASARFARIMHKHAVWAPGDAPLVYGG